VDDISAARALLLTATSEILVALDRLGHVVAESVIALRVSHRLLIQDQAGRGPGELPDGKRIGDEASATTGHLAGDEGTGRARPVALHTSDFRPTTRSAPPSAGLSAEQLAGEYTRARSAAMAQRPNRPQIGRA
jgi:hypothetical protein